MKPQPVFFYLRVLLRLLRGLSLCSIVLLSVGAAHSQAWPFDSNPTPPCTMPAGLYRAEQLGAGYDVLNFSVTSSGDIRGSYRLSAELNGQHSLILAETSFDSNSSTIQCHGDTIKIKTWITTGYLHLILAWDRALSKLHVTGSYTGHPSWTRWSIKYGLEAISIVGLVYSFVYVYRHWADFQGIYSRLLKPKEMNLMQQAASRARAMISQLGQNSFKWIKQSKSVLWIKGRLPCEIGEYLLDSHLHDLTLPVMGTLGAMTSASFIDDYTTYPLNGMGSQIIAGKREHKCSIPAGVYHAPWFSPRYNCPLAITVPIGLNKTDFAPEILVSSNSPTTYKITPSKLICHGNEIILEWESSSPASKGYITAFYDEEKGFIGAGVFVKSGWLSYEQPTLIPLLNFIKKDSN